MLKILLIDDEDNLTFFLKNNLELGGKYEVLVANDGKSGLHAFFKEKPDLVVLDITMPAIDGPEVLRLIRESEEKAGIMLGDGTPVIMLTAYDTQVIPSFKDGCDDYIIKPVKVDNLIAKIEEKLRGNK